MILTLHPLAANLESADDSLDPEQAKHNIGPDLGSKLFNPPTGYKYAKFIDRDELFSQIF